MVRFRKKLSKQILNHDSKFNQTPPQQVFCLLIAIYSFIWVFLRRRIIPSMPFRSGVRTRSSFCTKDGQKSPDYWRSGDFSSGQQPSGNSRKLRTSAPFHVWDELRYMLFSKIMWDIYCTRTRVMERLQLCAVFTPTRCPHARPRMAPVSWSRFLVPFWCTCKWDLGDQQGTQDYWYVNLPCRRFPVSRKWHPWRFWKQYQLIVDPVKLQYYNVSLLRWWIR